MPEYNEYIRIESSVSQKMYRIYWLLTNFKKGNMNDLLVWTIDHAQKSWIFLFGIPFYLFEVFNRTMMYNQVILQKHSSLNKPKLHSVYACNSTHLIVSIDQAENLTWNSSVKGLKSNKIENGWFDNHPFDRFFFLIENLLQSLGCCNILRKIRISKLSIPFS